MQSDLVNIRYARIRIISLSSAGGIGEEQYLEISNGLVQIFNFLGELLQGRNNLQPSFPSLPLLVRRSEEQVEEEGGNEEVEAQIINDNDIRDEANKAKGRILNYFINNSNTRPMWYNLLI
ncbi:MAG: hypothetical protein EZS28_025492 [Streblomastix strix]|uniref:Uncharacterized protein n=1 Tax=Streblomastix strix TaxID=222440 RepID=A0A5J4V962_9EUKA|nr:MAG: hypothetical protein EZS28_025492 [Streblomastix strix]